MTQYWFGGDMAGYVVDLGTDNAVVFAPGALVTGWSSETGGVQYTLTDSNGGALPAITTGTTGGKTGALPRFQGPDNIKAMWLSADGGDRMLAITTDVADIAEAARIASEAARASVETHLSAANPHGLRMVQLLDFDANDLSEGEWPIWNTAQQKFMPGTVAGLTDTVTTNTDQTVTGTKTYGGETAKTRMIVLAAAMQIDDLMQFLSTTGQKTTSMNARGELRVTAGATNTVGMIIKALTAQTAHLAEWTDPSNNPLAWVEPDGRIRAPNLGVLYPMTVRGNLVIANGVHTIYNDFGVQLQMRNWRASVGTAPLGADAVIDIKKNGVSIFATTEDRPRIPAGQKTSGKVVPANATLNDGDALTIDVVGIGDPVPGADLVVQGLAY